jgi:DNA polymerase-3 subunit alpha
MPDFVHLHCHSEYSLLDGAIRVKDLCSRAKDLGMPYTGFLSRLKTLGVARPARRRASSRTG